MMHSFNNYSWWGPGPLVGFGALGILGLFLLLVFIAAEVALKGFALWYAATRKEKWWFIAMLVINTAGILEIVYLVFFVHKWHQRIRSKRNGHSHPSHS